jgi:hypothetical protein
MEKEGWQENLPSMQAKTNYMNQRPDIANRGLDIKEDLGQQNIDQKAQMNEARMSNMFAPKGGPSTGGAPKSIWGDRIINDQNHVMKFNKSTGKYEDTGQIAKHGRTAEDAAAFKAATTQAGLDAKMKWANSLDDETGAQTAPQRAPSAPQINTPPANTKPDLKTRAAQLAGQNLTREQTKQKLMEEGY